MQVQDSRFSASEGASILPATQIVMVDKDAGFQALINDIISSRTMIRTKEI
jgi:hypothetical protein